MKSTTTITELDRKIILELSKDCRVSINKLSEKLDVAPMTVKNHLNRLFDENWIKTRLIFNGEKIGLNNIVDIFCKTKENNVKKIYESCMEYDNNIVYFAHHFNEQNISIQARFKNLNNLNKFINTLKENEEVKDVNYVFVSKIYKDLDDWKPKIG